MGSRSARIQPWCVQCLRLHRDGDSLMKFCGDALEEGYSKSSMGRQIKWGIEKELATGSTDDTNVSDNWLRRDSTTNICWSGGFTPGAGRGCFGDERGYSFSCRTPYEGPLQKLHEQCFLFRNCCLGIAVWELPFGIAILELLFRNCYLVISYLLLKGTSI